ncbi:DUF1294 domain-containing protein [Sporomusa termitida]|uniref:DUF1294 domain-containing protein n=1 Tax=Sporomusa termitida TaxID=2377 RepID=UPI001B866CAA|nr:DUF1294 domain-containing protein [Sporomusa termitida]
MNGEVELLLILWNTVTYGLMRYDKNQARKQGQRISERTLLLCAFWGGAGGIWCGMYSFRHKTKHKAFLIWLPVLFLMNLFGYYYFRWL